MRTPKKLVLLFAFMLVGLYGNMVYANDTVTGTKTQTEKVPQEDKKAEYLESEDGYIRITQPTKVNTSTFESKMNVMGEARENTIIIIKVNKVTLDDEENVVIAESKDYELNKIGSTKSFNQLIELFEGNNQIVLEYANEKDEAISGEMSFTIIKESEEKKETIKNTIVVPGKDIL